MSRRPGSRRAARPSAAGAAMRSSQKPQSERICSECAPVGAGGALIAPAAARFLASHDLQADGPGFCELVDELRDGSPVFAEVWLARRVVRRRDGRKRPRLAGGEARV